MKMWETKNENNSSEADDFYVFMHDEDEKTV
jgi:hypothetical protein